MNIFQKIDKYLLEKCDAATEWLWVEFEITKLSLLRVLAVILILLEIGYGASNELEFGWRLFHAFIPLGIQIYEESIKLRMTIKLQNGICLRLREMFMLQGIRLGMIVLAIPVNQELFNTLINLVVPIYYYFMLALISKKPPRRKLQYAEARGVA